MPATSSLGCLLQRAEIDIKVKNVKCIQYVRKLSYPTCQKFRDQLVLEIKLQIHGLNNGIG